MELERVRLPVELIEEDGVKVGIVSVPFDSEAIIIVSDIESHSFTLISISDYERQLSDKLGRPVVFIPTPCKIYTVRPE